MNKQPEVTEMTRKSYIDAFWKLYKDHPVERIGIGALSEEAGFTRTTFYRYFEDVYDLRRQAEDEFIAECGRTMHELIPDGVDSAVDPGIVKTLVKLFDIYGEKIVILTGKHGDPSFQDRLEDQARPLMRSAFGTDAGGWTSYIASFMYSAITGVLTRWYGDGRKLGEEELLAFIYRMNSEGAIKTFRGGKAS